MPKKTRQRLMPDKDNRIQNFITDKLKPLLASDEHCHMIGRVISYDKKRARCDVQPLPLQTDGDKRAALTDVVVPDDIKFINDLVDFMKYVDGFVQTYNSHTHTAPHGETSGPHGTYKAFDKEKEKHGFKVGSVVWVEYCDREMDNWTGKDNYKIDADAPRLHSVQDAIIGKVIQP